jgi:hypothetical protein
LIAKVGADNVNLKKQVFDLQVVLQIKKMIAKAEKEETRGRKKDLRVP